MVSLRSQLTIHDRQSTLHCEAYGKNAGVLAREDKEDIIKLKTIEFLTVNLVLKMSRTRVHDFDHLAHSL